MVSPELPRKIRLHRAAVWLIVCVVIVGSVALVSWLRRSDPPTAPYADARGAAGLRPGPPVTAYPWAHQQDPFVEDPWGFAERQCTSYVAWYLNSHDVPFARRTRGPAGVGHFGAATTWFAAARKAGFVTSSAPRVGSVAQWPAGKPRRDGTEGKRSGAPFRAGRLGHVAIVVHVYPNGLVRLAEFNGSTRRFQIRRGRAPHYLYIGLTPAHHR